MLTVAGAIERLEEALEEAPDEEKRAISESIFNLLQNAQLKLSVALGRVSKAEVEDLRIDEGNDEGEETQSCRGLWAGHLSFNHNRR